mmetsp:Transcript_7426/g.21593  ORF Transcript_7426/g.21593 Transcript_7426/m.21593 type:complete len:255 (-) Transcript_7426:2317-3081(-)
MPSTTSAARLVESAWFRLFVGVFRHIRRTQRSLHGADPIGREYRTTRHRDLIVFALGTQQSKRGRTNVGCSFRVHVRGTDSYFRLLRLGKNKAVARDARRVSRTETQQSQDNSRFVVVFRFHRARRTLHAHSGTTRIVNVHAEFVFRCIRSICRRRRFGQAVDFSELAALSVHRNTLFRQHHGLEIRIYRCFEHGFQIGGTRLTASSRSRWQKVNGNHNLGGRKGHAVLLEGLGFLHVWHNVQHIRNEHVRCRP